MWRHKRAIMKKIAVATSDGVHIDQEFGKTSEFYIYEKSEEGTDKGRFVLKEKRSVSEAEIGSQCGCREQKEKVCVCGGEASLQLVSRVDLIADCICVLCRHIGPGAEKLLDKRAVSVFSIDIPLEEALQKLAQYYH